MEKQKSKKGFAVLVTVLLLAVAAALGVFVFTMTDAGFFLKCHLSKAPRMNCEILLNVDGELYSLTEADVTALPMANGVENTISDFSSDVSGCTFRCKGGEYGEQPFQISFAYGDGKTAVIPVRPIVASSWEMSDVTVVISADSEQETYSYQITLRVNGKAYTRSGEAAFDDETGIKVSNV